MTDATPTHGTGKTAKIAVVGTGPAGLMAAEVLAERGVEVTLYDAMRSPARKFLLAGRGGLNLTHSEEFETLLSRYGAASARLRPALEAFSPEALREWCAALGEPTFVGTSGRVFPASFRATPLLRAWLKRLNDLGVRFAMRHRWQGWDAKGHPIFAAPDGLVEPEVDALILALAARAGRASARMAAGPTFWKEKASASRRCGRRIAAFAFPGRRISAAALPASRSKARSFLTARFVSAARRS